MKSFDEPKADLHQNARSFQELKQNLRPGIKESSPRFVVPDTDEPLGVGPTVAAALSQGLTATIFSGFEFDRKNVNLDYDVTQDMRPGDERYPALFALSPNQQETFRLQSYLDNKERMIDIASRRPYVSFGAQLLDPISLGIDIGTFGIGSMVAMPLVTGAARQTRIGMAISNALQQSPIAKGALKESLNGGVGGLSSVYSQAQIKGAFDATESDEDLATHLFVGTLVGAALGGGVGIIGAKRTQKIVNDFAKANKITQEIDLAPPEFVGPPKPTQVEIGVLSTGKKPDIRAEFKPEMSAEEKKLKAQELKSKVEASEEQRVSYYAELRANLTQIGENIGKKLHPWAKKALSLVSAPIRNMSSTNRMLASKFGTARLYAVSMTRNATEFYGTRKGFVVPMSAQNKIEDITNMAAAASVELHGLFLKANKIEGSVFASERQKLGNTLYEESKFYEDVATQMLHVGKKTEKIRGASPEVQQGAQLVWNNVYKPLGDLLKKHGVIEKTLPDDELINYLNRMWSTPKLLSDPEGFKNWLAEYFDKVNEQLKSIMPNYEAANNFARGMERDANRFGKAADKIEKLKSDIEKSGKEEKVKSLKSDLSNKKETIKQSFEDKRNKVKEKYAELRGNANDYERLPDISATKKALQKEIKDATKESDDLNKYFSKEKKKIQDEIKDIRNDLKIAKEKIRNGKKDSKIKERVFESNLEALELNPEFHQSTIDELQVVAREISDDLDDAAIRALREDMISEEQTIASMMIEEERSKLSILKEEERQLKDINKNELEAEVREATNLLEKEAKIAGKKSKEGKINRIIDIREKLELKQIDLKEKHSLFKNDVSYVKKINELNKNSIELDYLQRKFSREGFLAYVEKKYALKMAPHLAKEARRIERESIIKAKPTDEARSISDELSQGAAKERARAEAMIPDEFRSTTTGKPFRVYDKEADPLYSYNKAEASMYAMLGQEDEIVMNPVLSMLSGKPSMLKARNIKMPDDYVGIERWVERDIRFLMDNFTRGVAPVIALSEVMQELNKLPIVRDTVKRMQVLNPRIGPAKALDLPETMQFYTEIPGVMATMMRDEYRILAKGLEGKEAEKLLEEYKNMEAHLSNLDKIVKGVFGNGTNVSSSKAAEFIDIFNSAVSTVTTNNIVISMLSDLMSPALRYGFKDYLNKSLLPLLRSKELRLLKKEEHKALNIALKVGQGSIIKNRISGRPGSLKNSTFGKFMMNLSNRMGNWTGANGLQDLMETASTTLIETSLIDIAERIVLGKATEKELSHLAQRGVSPAKAKQIYAAWKRYGYTIEDSVKGFDITKIDSMGPKAAQAFIDYKAFVNSELKTVIAKPGMGSMPDMSYSPLGGAILYLKKYFFAATNDVLIPAAQRMDKEAAQGFIGLFAIGALQGEIRRLYRDEERKEFNLEGFIAEALTNSAIPGIYTWGVDLAIAYGIISGAEGARYDPSNGVASLLGGPGVIGYSAKMLGILGRISKITRDEDRQFTYKDWNYMANTAVPLYRWAPISVIAKPRIKEYFESIGREE